MDDYDTVCLIYSEGPGLILTPKLGILQLCYVIHIFSSATVLFYEEMCNVKSKKKKKKKTCWQVTWFYIQNNILNQGLYLATVKLF